MSKEKEKKVTTTRQVIVDRINDVYFKQDICNLILKIIFILIAVILVSKFVFSFKVIKSEAMVPNIKAEDLTMVYKLPSDYTNGEVVLLENDGSDYILRIIAKAGDTINLDENGKLLLNGNVLDEEYIYFDTYPSESISYPITIEEDEYFVLGDNRMKSKDSRDFGVIKKSDIKGKIIYIFRNRDI